MESRTLAVLCESQSLVQRELSEAKAVLHDFREQHKALFDRHDELTAIVEEAQNEVLMVSYKAGSMNLERFRCVRCGLSWLRDSEGTEMRTSEFRKLFMVNPHERVGSGKCKACHAL